MSNILQLLFAFFLIAGSHTTLADRNIVFFLVDDLGQQMLGLMEAVLRDAKNTDALAASVAIQQGYAVRLFTHPRHYDRTSSGSG